MASYRFELNAKPNRNKKYNILLCVTIAGKRKRIKTDIFLNRKSDFNASCKGNKWVKSTEPNYNIWNNTLADILEDARNKHKELQKNSTATAESVARLVKGEEQSTTFLKIDEKGMTGFAAERTQAILDAGAIRNWKKYNGFLNKLAGFLDKKMHHKKELLFAEITPELLTKFDDYLHTIHNSRSKKEAGKMLHQNYIVVIFNIFRTLVKKGMELGYITPDKNPFLVFKYSGVKTEKEKLDLAEIDALEALELEEGSLDWHSRNCFLFSFYCAGIRAGDLLQLRWINVEGGRLKYQMGKNHKTRDLKLVPQAAAILDLYRSETSKPTDYIFPFMDNRKTYASAISQADRDILPSDMKKKLLQEVEDKNALLNKSLKRIAGKAGITKKVSMHISRHSFASIAVQKGLESNKVKSLLAHSRLQTTEGYMGNFSSSENDKALESVFEHPADKKAQLLALIQGMSEEDVTSVLAILNK
jgi:integrase